MGKIKTNVVTRGFSGKLGDDLVFRQVDNKTVFAKLTPRHGQPSAQQLEIRNKFTEASLYAGSAIEDPQALQDYTKMAKLGRMKSAYVAAVTDYLSEPEIGGVYTFAYKGAVGNIISITPRVAMKIIQIEVSLLRPDGTVIESGVATQNKFKFRYTATVANAQVSGTKLVIVSHDRIGKKVTIERVL